MRIKIVVLFIIISAQAYSQSNKVFSEYQGANFYLYKGAALYTKHDKGYNLINKVFHSLNDAKYKKVAYPVSVYETSRDSLLDGPIYVLDVVDIEGNSVAAQYDKTVFLKCEFKSTLLYIRYVPDNKYNFPFDAVLTDDNRKYVADKYANRYKDALEVSKDDFTGVITVSTPYNLDPIPRKDKRHIPGKYAHVTLFKEYSKNKSVAYYMQLDADGLEYDILKKGVIILFPDGSRFEKPNVSIQVSPGVGRQFNYYAVIKLNENDINLFSKKKIDKYRLYRHDEELSEDNAYHITEYMKALSKYKL